MNLTNKHNLPDAIVNAMIAQQEDYKRDRGNADISVTTLIAPPQIDVLSREHGDAITEDASDRLWALMGTAMHNVLESAKTDALVENRLYGKYAGWTVSGKYDRMLVSDGLLQDYKFSSVWEYMYGLKEERVQQLNCLAQLAIDNGYDIRQLEVVMLFRDWSATKAATQADYPKSQIARLPVKLWQPGERIEFIEHRVSLHKAARAGERIHCTDEERWVNGQKWAVMKKGRKSALKVCDSEDECQRFMMSKGISDADNIHYIEFRPGTYTRCERYCAVADFCPQYQHDKE